MGRLRFRCRGRSGGAKCWRTEENGTHATIEVIAAA
jgi:hypothetical protein